MNFVHCKISTWGPSWQEQIPDAEVKNRQHPVLCVTVCSIIFTKGVEWCGKLLHEWTAEEGGCVEEGAGRDWAGGDCGVG